MSLQLPVSIAPASASVSLGRASLELESSLGNALANLFEPFLNSFVESSLDRELPRYLDQATALVESSLNRAARTYDLVVPKLDGSSGDIAVAIAHSRVDFDASGATLDFAGSAYSSNEAPYDKHDAERARAVRARAPWHDRPAIFAGLHRASSFDRAFTQNNPMLK